MSQPSFTTQRLLLRPRTLADTDACIAMDRDPEVTRFIPGPWDDEAAHRAFINERTRGPYPAGLGYWSLFRRDAPDDFLGWVLLIPADASGREVEIGWRLKRNAWGQGLATEAAIPLIAHGFKTAGLERIVADIAPANTASIKVAEKLGLTATDRTPDHDINFIRYALTHPGDKRTDA